MNILKTLGESVKAGVISAPIKTAGGFVGGFMAGGAGMGWLGVSVAFLVGYTAGKTIVGMARTWWANR